MKENSKKFIFYVIVIVVSIITFYLVVNTVYINFNSYSKGLVHWHADLEIMICGKEVELEKSESFFSNKVGIPEVHHHGDMRIHIEGVVNKREEATLGYFFDSINEDFTNESILNHKNGELCNGKPGKLRMFVNDKENFEFRNYEIKHYIDVPPGDKIKFVFE